MQTAEASFSDERGYIFVVVLGLFIGSLVGAMAQVIPYAMVLLSGMGVAVLAWRQEGSVSLIVTVMGLLLGSLFGSMANVMPYGVSIFLAVILGIMIWRTQGGGASMQGPSSAIALVLFIMLGVGFLWSGTYLDFCNPTLGATDACLTPAATGYITAYQGCVNDCAITAFTFLGNSPVAFLIQGDFVAFISSFISGIQSPFTVGPSNFFWSIISSIITAATAVLLLFLGSGFGIQAQVVASGGSITPNDAGTRMFQSLGMTLLMWASITGLVFNFGQWFGYIGFGLGSGSGSGLPGGALYVMFLLYVTYQAYLQGKTIAS